jgi:hypothetical protein
MPARARDKDPALPVAGMAWRSAVTLDLSLPSQNRGAAFHCQQVTEAAGSFRRWPVLLLN